jgi:hypothetical protein
MAPAIEAMIAARSSLDTNLCIVVCELSMIALVRYG